MLYTHIHTLTCYAINIHTVYLLGFSRFALWIENNYTVQIYYLCLLFSLSLEF